MRPFSPCHPTQAVAVPMVSHTRNPYPAIPGGFNNFQGRLYLHAGFPDSGCMVRFRTQAPHQCFGAQGGNVGSPTLGLSFTGPQVRIATDNTTVVAYIIKQGGTHWDPFPHPVAAGSSSVFMARDSRYSLPGQTHSGLPQCNSRPVISAEPAHHNRVEFPH